MSFHSKFDDKQVLDTIFCRQPKIPTWKFDKMKVDLTGLQKAALKRVYSRRESLREAATHLGLTVRDLNHILRTAKRRLKKYRKFLKAQKNETLVHNQDSKND